MQCSLQSKKKLIRKKPIKRRRTDKTYLCVKGISSKCLSRIFTISHIIMINNELNVATLEYNIAWGDKNANLNIVTDAVSRLPHGIDLVVLPEMFSTGFITDNHQNAANLAERNTQNTISVLKKLAATHNFAIAGSFIAHTASQLYNRAFFIEPNGEETFYDKRHLFRMGGECEIYSSGKTFSPEIRYRGWNIKIIVCYDLRFPAWCRNNFERNSPYDLMLVIANWPKARLHPWKTLLAARAIENLSYVCGINRSGIDPNGIDYASGSSTLYDFKGLTCTPQTIPISDGNIFIYSLSHQPLNHFRQKFPAWKDTDPFTLKI